MHSTTINFWRIMKRKKYLHHHKTSEALWKEKKDHINGDDNINSMSHVNQWFFFMFFNLF